VTLPDSELLSAQTSAVLVAALQELGSVVVAFSGGTDSAYLAWSAMQVLGAERVLAVTALSASLASGEREHCQSLAEQWGLPWQCVDTDELANPQYVANAGDRCYWCKAELMDAVGPIAQQRGATVVLGVNIDDLGEHRPGQGAARERGARFPLVDAGLTKQMIREASQAAGLSTWDRPAAACLSSRIPYGTPVSIGVLSRVDRAEAALRSLGLRQLRVRHYDDTARIEVDLPEIGVVFERRDQIVSALKSVGYRYVTLDLEGFRSGNLNQAL
jgi:uncharacterized protein